MALEGDYGVIYKWFEGNAFGVLQSSAWLS